MQPFHIVTVGMSPTLVRDLWDRVCSREHLKISHIAHPSFSASEWSISGSNTPVKFFNGELLNDMPAAEPDLLASLEGGDVPTVHNMIMSDRFVNALPYELALRYATFLTRRLLVLYRELQPSLIIGGFDSLHGSLGFAVARREGIPWFALMFSSLPAGQVAICSNLSPSSAITFEADRVVELKGTAEEVLRNFENREIQAAAYIPPKLLTISFILKQLPVQLAAIPKVIAKRRRRKYLRFTNAKNSYSLAGLLQEALRLRKNVWQMPHKILHQHPADKPYAFFGLHTQPESSVDVWAHFFSNQLRVVEMMARSIPPTHTLYVKLHKSDIPNYSRAALNQMLQLPGVKLVSPGADTFGFIRGAAIIFSIQGTIGLEGALLGKPVIMFGDSPVKAFPGVSTFGKTIDLPTLVRAKISQLAPNRDAVVNALAAYLAPFYPGSSNDWTRRPADFEIAGYVRVLRLLEDYVGKFPAARPRGAA